MITISNQTRVARGLKVSFGESERDGKWSTVPEVDKVTQRGVRVGETLDTLVDKGIAEQKGSSLLYRPTDGLIAGNPGDLLGDDGDKDRKPPRDDGKKPRRPDGGKKPRRRDDGKKPRDERDDKKPRDDRKPRDDKKPRDDRRDDGKPRDDRKPRDDGKPRDDRKPRDDSKPGDRNTRNTGPSMSRRPARLHRPHGRRTGKKPSNPMSNTAGLMTASLFGGFGGGGGGTSVAPRGGGYTTTGFM